MPKAKVVLFRQEDGSSPVIEFFTFCANRDKRIIGKIRERIGRLQELGWELKRPESDTLRDGIHELRIRFQSVNYRILYSFCRDTDTGDQTIALLSHGCTKEDEVPPAAIDLALARHNLYKSNPTKYTYIKDKSKNQASE